MCILVSLLLGLLNRIRHESRSLAMGTSAVREPAVPLRAVPAVPRHVKDHPKVRGEPLAAENSLKTH